MKKIIIAITMSLMMSATLVADYVVDISKYPVLFSNSRSECIHIARFKLNDLNNMMEYFEHSSTQMITQNKDYVKTGSYYDDGYEELYFFSSEDTCYTYAEYIIIINDSAKYR